MTPEQKKLADRILKLLALASSTNFAAEAENARRMADELVRAHNISLGPGKPSQDTIEVRDYTPFAKGMRWEGIIAVAVANLCMCSVFWDDGYTSYSFVGTIWNLDCLDYMVREANRQRIAAWLDYKRTGADSFNKFCYGFATALKDKIQRITDTVSVHANDAKLTLWYENYLGIKVQPSSLSMGAASSEAGMAAGDGASLHRGALGQPQKLLGR
jgi:hypothetical protein